jgi:hypothetical protein
LTVGERKKHLTRLTIGQQAFARLIRINPSTVRRWLNVDDLLDIPGVVDLLLQALTPAKAKQIMKEAGEALLS